MKILIFGTSKGKDDVEKYLDFNKVTIVGYIDNDISKQKTKLNNVNVYSPNEILNLEYDFIIISSSTFDREMKKQLLSLGVDEEKILNKFKLSSPNVRKLLKQSFNQVEIKKLMLKDDYIKPVNHYIVSQNYKMLKKQLNFYDYKDCSLDAIDFVRLSTVNLLANQLIEKGVKGAIAELGVYKGDFSKFLSILFPNEQFYLFDTFEGFSEKDLIIEKINNYSNPKKGHFADTNIDIVLGKIENPRRVKIFKGYFPDSIPDNFQETFSLVSIDVDLYNPTYEGLKFFYKKLVKGGYIIVHDYNFEHYSGVKSAVDKFCQEQGITPFPVADFHGSVIITK